MACPRTDLRRDRERLSVHLSRPTWVSVSRRTWAILCSPRLVVQLHWILLVGHPSRMLPQGTSRALLVSAAQFLTIHISQDQLALDAWTFTSEVAQDPGSATGLIGDCAVANGASKFRDASCRMSAEMYRRKYTRSSDHTAVTRLRCTRLSVAANGSRPLPSRSPVCRTPISSVGIWHLL